jgi:hypothetical protein
MGQSGVEYGNVSTDGLVQRVLNTIELGQKACSEKIREAAEIHSSLSSSGHDRRNAARTMEQTQKALDVLSEARRRVEAAHEATKRTPALEDELRARLITALNPKFTWSRRF